MSAQHEHDPAEIATRTIYQEHINLWRIILLLDRLQRDIDERDEEPDEVLISSILDYFEQFSERVQSGPNEILLFERLRQRNAGSFAELDELERDYLTAHQALQGLRQQLHDCVTNWPQGREQLSAALGDFTTHLRGHIQQEEQLLIPRARELLTPADWSEIAAAKDQYDDPLFGERVREEFRELRHHIINIAPEHVGGLGIQHKTRIEPQTHEQILTVSSLSTSYGRIQALYDVDLSIRSGEIVALVGANGAGKSTLLMTLSGLQPADSGTITYRHHDLTRMPAHRRVHEGIVQIPEGRQVFRDLSVHDNLLMGAYTRGRDAQVMTDLDNIYSRFPVLRQKQHQLAGMLSGGQQQMLAIGRALMAAPRLLLLDEPSMGLAPLVVEEIFNILRDLNREGITLFLVEQNASQALSIADRGYVLEAGKVVLSGSGEQLLADDKVREAYLGL